jgi:PAS domain S-box-containing protein
MDNQTQNDSRADLLIQSITDYAIYMLDCDGLIASWNPGAERLKGYVPEEVIGSHFSRFYTEKDRADGRPQRALRTALEQGRFEDEGWRVRKDGSRFWASVVVDPIKDADGTHVGYAKITRDLSERKRAEEALRESEERFRLLVQGVTDYAIYMLDLEGRVSSWNAGAERIKGYSAEEIIGEHFSKFYTPEDLERDIPTKALATAAAEGRFEAEGWRKKKDGRRFWASVVIDAIRDDDENLRGFTKITRDLTERKLAQDELEASREQLFQSQKMESLGQLTGGVAHDFNNILAAIMSSLGLAQRRLAKGKSADKFIENAILATERGASLTQRMLAFARKQELSLEPIDLVGVMGEMAQLLERTIGPEISIRLDLPLRLPHVTADAAQLELAIMNLSVNARDAMPDGGKIIFSAEEASTPNGEDYVRLTVSDEGEGMDTDTLDKATEPFFTTKGIGKGTGLGLSMVRGMAEQCGGRFDIESELGRGTSAILWLKVADSAPADAEELVSKPSEAKRARRILAVDDDGIILFNTATILEEMGHEVFQAPSGPAALELLATEEIDVLVTDFAMPDMTGAELAEKAIELQPNLKIILASGYADLPEGAPRKLPRISKPFRESELADAIEAVSR